MRRVIIVDVVFFISYHTTTPQSQQCLEGHIICGDCVGKVKRCPICRCENMSARNHALEQLASGLTVNCCYQASGCPVTGKLNEVNTHEKKCHFHPLKCPWAGCDHQATGSELIKHLKDVHSAVSGAHYRMNVSSDPGLFPPFITEGREHTIVTKVNILRPHDGPYPYPYP